MRAPQRIEKKIEEVASLLIPLQGRMLLASWREQTIPLLSFEVMNGEEKPGVVTRSRFAVINTTGQHDALPFIAILTQGLPRLARVTEEEITEREDADKKPFELMHVSWAGEEAVIPDVEAMERAFLDYLHLDN